MTPETHDFRKPGRLSAELERRLGGWFRRFSTLVPERWAKHFSFPLEMHLQALSASGAEAAQAGLPEPAVGFRLRVAPPETLTLLVLPRPLLLALGAGLLGDDAATLPADRELTTVEESLAEFWVRRLLADVLEEAWPELDPVRLQLRETEPAPRFARLWPPDSKVALASFLVRGPFGEQPCSWLLPMKGWLEQLDRPKAGPAGPTPAARTEMEPVVRELPVEITVTLGSAELPLSEVGRLRVGDLLVLDQLTTEPLTAHVAGAPHFRVWPGKVSSRQAVTIASFLKE